MLLLLLLLSLFLIKPDSVQVFCFLASKTYFLLVYFNNPDTHPVHGPPAEHLVESSEQNEEHAAEDFKEPHSKTCGHGQEAADSETNEEGTNGKRKGKPGNSVQRCFRKKKRLCDVVEQSNLHMQSLNESLASGSISKETRAREREEDREFFRSIMGMMSQTMMGMTQLLLQGAGPGMGHSPGLQPMMGMTQLLVQGAGPGMGHSPGLQPMMGMTQLLVQGAGPGMGHSPGLQPMMEMTRLLVQGAGPGMGHSPGLQPMMGMTQLLVQGAGPGMGHSPGLQPMMEMTRLLVQGAGPGMGHSPGLQPMYPPPMTFRGYLPPVHRPSTPSSFTTYQSTSGDEVSDVFSL